MQGAAERGQHEGAPGERCGQLHGDGTGEGGPAEGRERGIAGDGDQASRQVEQPDLDPRPVQPLKRGAERVAYHERHQREGRERHPPRSAGAQAEPRGERRRRGDQEQRGGHPRRHDEPERVPDDRRRAPRSILRVHADEPQDGVAKIEAGDRQHDRLEILGRDDASEIGGGEAADQDELCHEPQRGQPHRPDVPDQRIGGNQPPPVRNIEVRKSVNVGRRQACPACCAARCEGTRGAAGRGDRESARGGSGAAPGGGARRTRT